MLHQIFSKTMFYKLLVFLVGCFITQIGVSLLIQSNTGTDSITLFMQGLKNVLNITVGSANIIVMAILFIFMLLFARQYINIGTFLAIVTVGPFLDLINLVVEPLQISQLPLSLRIILVALSCLIISFGFSIFKSAQLGVSPIDEFVFIISDFTSWQYRYVRMILDFTYITVGFYLGGQLGIGTIIPMFLIGPSIQYMLPKVETYLFSLSTLKSLSSYKKSI